MEVGELDLLVENVDKDSNESLSLVYLDYDSENENGDQSWSHGKGISTILISCEDMEEFESKQLDLKVVKPRLMKMRDKLNQFITNSLELFVYKGNSTKQLDYLCKHRKHFLLINETLAVRLLNIKYNRF